MRFAILFLFCFASVASAGRSVVVSRATTGCVHCTQQQAVDLGVQRFTEVQQVPVEVTTEVRRTAVVPSIAVTEVRTLPAMATRRETFVERLRSKLTRRKLGQKI